MKNGRIVEHGTYQDLVARGVDFSAEVAHAQPAKSTPVMLGSEPAVDHAPANLDGTQAQLSSCRGANQRYCAGGRLRQAIRLCKSPSQPRRKQRRPLRACRKAT